MNKTQSLLNNTHYQKLEEKQLQSLCKTLFQGKSILDIGCGQGKYLRLLRNHCAQLTGVDANETQVNTLRQEGFEVYKPGELPTQKKYDVLLMSHIIEHLSPKELVEFMDNYLPMLADDGILLILTPMPGLRFWYDYTHIRPYTPQSLGMMFGILNGPFAFGPKNKMQLERIWFFRDSWRIRNSKFYFRPHPDEESSSTLLFQKIIFIINIFLASLHSLSGGRLGALASWMGIYRNIGNKK